MERMPGPDWAIVSCAMSSALKYCCTWVDVSDFAQNPVADYQIVARELEAYSQEVAAKPKIVVATKIDAASADQRRQDFEEGANRLTSSVEEFEEFLRAPWIEFHAISAATGRRLEGIVARGLAAAG